MLSPKTARQATPLSPSPSPEPPGGAASRQSGSAANGHPLGSGAAQAVNTGQAQHDTAIGANDPNEQARQALENCTRNAIAELYQLAVCTADVQPGQEDVVGARINQVIASLSSLSEAGSNQDLSVLVPEDVMTVIDRGRNPDFHTRTSLSELVTHNQHVAATTMTFDSYYDQLADSVSRAFPELAEDIEQLKHVSDHSQRPSDMRDPDQEVQATHAA